MNWKSGKLSGTKDSIKAKVTETELPQNAKDYILAEVASLPETVSIVSVTGYSSDHSNPIHAGAITRNIQITISCATL